MQIDGKAIQRRILDEVKKRPKTTKIFGAVLVGEDPSSVNFLRIKKKTAAELGVDFRIYEFLPTITNDELRDEIGKLGQSKAVGGLVLQLPLPGELNRHYALNAIPREKDVDALSERALGAFYTERNPVLPPAVATTEEILKEKKFDLSRATVAVVGMGILVGKPVATWLIGKAREIIMLDKESDLSLISRADLVVLGAGAGGFIKTSMLKPGAAVIDFGYSEKNGTWIGDFDPEPLSMSEKKLAFYTPTPGGTGPILVAKLFENFYKLLEKI
jgi:methylenetetrahydrofolate dehydrogenase (NADP+)/methenyltetrahydrofolate cyclohydrolase